MAKISWGSSVFLVMILFMIPKLKSADPNLQCYYCSNTSTFDAADTSYPKNLNSVFSSLSSAAATSTTGFGTASAGNGTKDAVFGLFLCRGDQTPSSCSDCVATAVRDQPKRSTCSRSKVGIIWYDECMIRYDDENFFGRMDQTPGYLFFNTQNITGNQSRFTELLGDTMTGLAVQTAKGGAGKKYGTRVVRFTSLQTVYALEQCTPDLSYNDCEQCLTAAIGEIGVSRGVRILQPSCNVRYEIYPFFNGATNNISSPPPSSPPSTTTNSSTGVGSAPGNGKSTSHFSILLIFFLNFTS